MSRYTIQADWSDAPDVSRRLFVTGASAAATAIAVAGPPAVAHATDFLQTIRDADAFRSLAPMAAPDAISWGPVRGQVAYFLDIPPGGYITQFGRDLPTILKIFNGHDWVPLRDEEQALELAGLTKV